MKKILDEAAEMRRGLIIYKKYFEITNHWLLLKQQGKDIEGFFVDKGFKKVAIHGMRDMGYRLYADIKRMKYTNVGYLIDENEKRLATFLPNESINPINWYKEGADVIVVTSVHDFEMIKKDLQKKTKIKIVSLEDVIFYTYENPLLKYE